MLQLLQIKKTDERLQRLMKIHYSQPKEFVGRNLNYAILYNDVFYGAICAGSACLHLPGRNEFFGIEQGPERLGGIINNVFYHIEKVNDKYPTRNFAQIVLREFCYRALYDWEARYNTKAIGFESLVELPRTGEIYKREGWMNVGTTKGYLLKRGVGKNGYSQKIFTYDPSRRKLVFCKLAKEL